MTQNLYYSSTSSSLVLVQDGAASTSWSDVSSLIVCSSLYEVVAFSGSVKLAAFPIEDTNIYYTETYTITPPALIPDIPTQSYSSLKVVFNITNVADADTGSCKFFITSSAYAYSSSAYSTAAWLGILPQYTYTIGVTGSGTYDASLYLYDITSASFIPGLPGYLIGESTGSNIGVSASVAIQANHNYAAYLDIVNALP